MPKLDPSNAPQAPAAAPAPATPAKTPEPSAKIQEPGGGTPAAANAPPASAEPLDLPALAEQLASARETGNTKRATELQAIIAGRPLRAAAEPEPEPVVEAQAEPEPVEGETPGDPEDTAPAGDETGEETGEGEGGEDNETVGQGDNEPGFDLPKELPNRLRTGHLSKEDRAKATAIHALTMGGMTYAQASDIVLGAGGRQSDNQTGGQSEEEASPSLPVSSSPSLSALEAEVLALEQQFNEQGSYEGQFNTTVAEITAKLIKANARLEAQRSREQSEAQESQRAVAAHGTQVKSSEAKAFARFPAAQDKASPLYQRFLEKCLAANHPSHPDHERSFAADAPEYFLAKAAGELGVKPAATNARTVPVPPAQAVRGAAPANGAARPNGAPATRPAPGSKASSPPPAPKTSAQLVQEKYAAVDAIETGRSRPTQQRIGGMITI